MHGTTEKKSRQNGSAFITSSEANYRSISPTMTKIPHPAPNPYTVGDRVQIYLDPRDADSQYHGVTCAVVDVHVDDLGAETERPTDAYSYTLRNTHSGDDLPLSFATRIWFPFTRRTNKRLLHHNRDPNLQLPCATTAISRAGLLHKATDFSRSYSSPSTSSTASCTFVFAHCCRASSGHNYPLASAVEARGEIVSVSQRIGITVADWVNHGSPS